MQKSEMMINVYRSCIPIVIKTVNCDIYFSFHNSCRSSDKTKSWNIIFALKVSPNWPFKKTNKFYRNVLKQSGINRQTRK